MDFNALFGRMAQEGQTAFGDVWGRVQTFAIPELRKIAVQILAIKDHLDEITPDTARLLVEMQVRAAVGVIVAMTELTMLAVQNAINAILGAVRDMVNGALPFPLL